MRPRSFCVVPCRRHAAAATFVAGSHAAVPGVTIRGIGEAAFVAGWLPAVWFLLLDGGIEPPPSSIDANRASDGAV